MKAAPPLSASGSASAAVSRPRPALIGADAFRRAFDDYYEPLCGFAVRYVGSLDEAREVVQDVFLKVWQRRETLEISASLKSYLYRGVHNQALNYAERRRRLTDFEAVEPQADDRADSRAICGELAATVGRAVAEMPERRQMAFRLHREEGMSYAEIGEAMGISPRTVEVHISAALRDLRARVFPETGEPG